MAFFDLTILQVIDLPSIPASEKKRRISAYAVSRSFSSSGKSHFRQIPFVVSKQPSGHTLSHFGVNGLCSFNKGMKAGSPFGNDGIWYDLISIDLKS